MIEPWKLLGEKVDYDCGYFKVSGAAQRLTPDQGGTFLLRIGDPFLDQYHRPHPGRKVLLVSQFRHGTMGLSLEIPGGAVDKRDPPAPGSGEAGAFGGNGA